MKGIQTLAAGLIALGATITLAAGQITTGATATQTELDLRTKAAMLAADWSNPSYLSTYETQYRWSLDRLELAMGDEGADLLVLLEPLDRSILTGLTERYGAGLSHEPTTLANATVRLVEGQKATVAKSTTLQDGRLLVRVPGPEGGWIGQSLTLHVRADAHTQSGEVVRAIDDLQQFQITLP